MKRVLILVASVALLHGCALALVGAGGAAGVAGADAMQTADRTFTAPLEQVRTATNQALAQMDLRTNADTTTASGRHIVATANDRTIDIDLENVTYNTTRMTVEVKTYNGILRDGATANTVVQKTGEMLASAGTAAPPPNAATAPAPQPLPEATPVAPPPGPSPSIQSQPLQ
ncbi:MAG: DUF3568 family protein [Alphaproteobacteria bacterium]|nr:DUF3568 family protein [Alphaproteobacteria bacterium]